MPGKIPTPGRRKHRKKADLLPAETNPIKRRPALPKIKGLKWHPMTKIWWDSTWTSPMAGEFLRSDISALQMLAVLINQFWADPKPSLAAEIRMRERSFGLTPIDRRRLEWEITKTDEAIDKREAQRARRAIVVNDPRENWKP